MRRKIPSNASLISFEAAARYKNFLGQQKMGTEMQWNENRVKALTSLASLGSEVRGCHFQKTTTPKTPISKWVSSRE